MSVSQLKDMSSSSSSAVSPNENDVVSGKGSGANKHKGNLNFRQLIKDNKSYYLSLSKNLKMGVAKRIFEQIAGLDPPGRFLQKNPETDAWFAIKDHRAHEKISQALREKPHAKKLDHPHLHYNDDSGQLRYSRKSNGHHQQFQQYGEMLEMRHASAGQQPPSMKVQEVMNQPRIVPMQNGLQTATIPPPPPRVIHQQQQQRLGSQPLNGYQYHEMRGQGNYMCNQQQMMLPPQIQSHGPHSLVVQTTHGPPSRVVQTNDTFQQQQQHQLLNHNHNHDQFQPNQQMQYQPYPMQQGSQSYSSMNTNTNIMHANTNAMHPMQQGSQQSYPSMNTPVMRKIVYTDAQGRVIQEKHPQPQMVPVQSMHTDMPSLPAVPREYSGSSRSSAPQQCAQGYSSMHQLQSKSLQYQHPHQSHGMQYQQQQPYPSQSRGLHAPDQPNSSHMPSQMTMQGPRYANEGTRVMNSISPVDARYIPHNGRKRSRSNHSEYSTEAAVDTKHSQTSSTKCVPNDDMLQNFGETKKSKVPLPLTVQATSTNSQEEATPVPLVSPFNEEKKQPLSGDGEEEEVGSRDSGLNTLSTAAIMMSEQ